MSLTFKDIDNFIVPKNEINFRLWISVNDIWYQKEWKNIIDASITKVTFSDSVGVTSWYDINSFSIDISTESFSIVSGIPFITKISDLTNSSVVKFNIKWLFWNNTVDTSNSTPKISLNTLKFNFYDNSNSAIFKLVNSDDSSEEIIWTKSDSIVEFDLSTLSSNNKTISNWKGEDFKIYISNTNWLISLELLKNWINYKVLWVSGATDLNINLSEAINFWTRDY